MTFKIKRVTVEVAACSTVLLVVSALLLPFFPEIALIYPIMFFSLLLHEIGHVVPALGVCAGTIEIYVNCFKGETYAGNATSPATLSHGRLIAFYVTGPVVGVVVSLLVFVAALMSSSAIVAFTSAAVAAIHASSLLPIRYGSDMSRLMRALELVDNYSNKNSR